jgi:hypothetical protein
MDVESRIVVSKKLKKAGTGDIEGLGKKYKIDRDIKF